MKWPVLLAFAAVCGTAQTRLTPVPRGAIHVRGNRLVDGAGTPFVLRGTELPAGTAISATTFSTIRIRWNMNAVRLTADVRLAADPGYGANLADSVRKARDAGLVVILAASDPVDSSGLPRPVVADFWRKWALEFRDDAGLIFDLYDQPHSRGWAAWRDAMQGLIAVVRSAGATQPVAVEAPVDGPGFDGFDPLFDDAGVIHEVLPRWNPAGRDREFGDFAARVPVLAAGWGFTPGEDSAACRALPRDSAGAEAAIQDALQYYDDHAISWTAGPFLPGGVVVDYVDYFNSELPPSWNCDGHAQGGIGEVLRYWLWSVDDDQFISVNGASGSPAIAPASLVVAYARSISEVTEVAGSDPLPTMLGGIQVEITDSAGAVRLAPLRFVSPTLAHYILPPETAPGDARVRVIDAAGTGRSGPALVLPAAPGLFAADGSGRGAVYGWVLDESGNRTPLADCSVGRCPAVPVRLLPGGDTRAVLLCEGLRNIGFAAKLELRVGGIQVPVVSIGVSAAIPIVDELVIALPETLRGIGETDLVLIAGGDATNVLRIAIE